MRILVAGSGSIGRRHLHNLTGLDPGCSCLLLRADGREDECSRQFQAQVVQTVDQALADRIDAVLIATPSAQHADLLLEAIPAGLPVYVEKPVVTTGSDVLAVQAACERHGYHAASQVGCNLRLLPSLQRMRALVHEGAIGRVVRASLEAGQWLPDWRPQQDHRHSYSADPERGGGVIFDLIHELDAARWLLGELHPCACLSATVPALEINSEAIAVALLRSEAGVLLQIGLDYVARRPLRRYQLVGDTGTLTWDLPGQRLILDNARGSELIDCGEQGFDVALTYRKALAEFLKAVQSAGTTTQPIQEGLRTAALAIRLKELACLNP